MQDISSYATISLPMPWPPQADALAFERLGDDTKIALWYTTSGRLRASAETPGEARLVIESPLIQVSGRGITKILVGLRVQAGTLKLNLNATDVGPNDPPLNLKAEIPRLRKQETFDVAGIKDALTRRTQRNLDYRQGGITGAQIEQMWADLGRECRLLQSALTRLRNGQLDDVVTVSVCLRKMVGGGKGNHVLQDCAGLDGSTIPVWMKPPAAADAWTPARLDQAKLVLWQFELFTSAPYEFNTHRSDLDVWLAANSGTVGSKPLSNLEKLHEVADKIGAHLDRKRQTVEILQSLNVGPVPALADYLRRLGEGIFAITDRLLKEHAAKSWSKVRRNALCPCGSGKRHKHCHGATV